jgi:hypothetical protein
MPARIVRYGKSSEGLINVKRDFFDNNDEYLAYEQRLARAYVAQPRRTRCKCCDVELAGTRFAKQGIDYVLCARCGHLSGAHEDTDAYNAEVYTGGGGSDYSRFYSVDGRRAYEERMAAIYLPKVDFLVSSLRTLGDAPEQMSFVDLGAGSGYLVASLIARDMTAIGYEVGESQVAFGNAMIGRDALHLHRLDEIDRLAATTEHDVVTMIGVLEHLQRPREFLRALVANPRVKYLLISVPLFAPSVFIEMVFPYVMQRHLSGGHTHLYTASSLEWMARELAIEPVAEWWFGTDVVDLYRAFIVALRKNADTARMLDTWTALFAPVIDELQLVLDKRHLSSEVHVLYRLRA